MKTQNEILNAVKANQAALQSAADDLQYALRDTCGINYEDAYDDLIYVIYMRRSITELSEYVFNQFELKNSSVAVSYALAKKFGNEVEALIN